MYEFDQWVIWAGMILSAIETFKIIAAKWQLKAKLTDEAYGALLYGIAFVIALVITVGFEADLFASMLGEYRFEPVVGQIAGAVALAFGETVLGEIWDMKYLFKLLKSKANPDA